MTEVAEFPVIIESDTDTFLEPSGIVPAVNRPVNANLSRCPYCCRMTSIIWVHGHQQCMSCRNVVVSCCEPE